MHGVPYSPGGEYICKKRRSYIECCHDQRWPPNIEALSEVVDVCTRASHCNDSFFMYDVSVGGHMKKDALVNKL